MDEDEFILARRYNVLERFSEYERRGDQGMVQEMKGEGQFRVMNWLYSIFITFRERIK